MAARPSHFWRRKFSGRAARKKEEDARITGFILIMYWDMIRHVGSSVKKTQKPDYELTWIAFSSYFFYKLFFSGCRACFVLMHLRRNYYLCLNTCVLLMLLSK